MTLAFFDATAWANGTDPETCTATWALGDEVLIWGFGENDATTLATPTATGLGTVSLVASVVTTGEASAYLWRVTASSAQVGQTISATKAGGSSHAGLAATVIPGGVSSLTALTGSNAEAAFNTAVAAGDGVAVGFGDFTATLGAETYTTGSGTPNERVEFVNSQYGVWIADWEGTAAGTFDFGRASYTGLAVAQVGAKWTPAGGTVDQAAFRWGEDDANEAGHTWTAAQDTDITSPLDQKLLRILLQTAGDEPAIPWKLRHQIDGAGGYVDTPVGASVVEAWGTVTFGAIGTGANGSTTVAPSYPAGITAGQYLVCVVTSGATNSETPTTPSGWTLLGTGASTDGTYGVDAGPRRATAFGKEADGTESGTLTVAITNGGTCRGTISRFTKAGSGAWVVEGFGADDSTSGTGVSMTFGTVDWHDGDAVLVATGQRVDSATQSAQSMTATGITFGTRTNRAATAVTTGNDHRHTVDTFAAVSAANPSESAAPTWAYTASAAASAGGVLVRLREYTAPVTNPVYIAPSTFVAAGGEATTQRLSGGTGTFTTGRRWDDENGADTLDVAADGNTELEFSVALQALADAQFVDFRLSPVDTFTDTPRWTVGSGGGTSYTKTPADPVGATDARTVVASVVRGPADPVGATDARTVVRSVPRTQADPASVTDTAARAVAGVRSRPDPVGVSDAAARLVAAARTQADPVGVADARTVVVSSARSRADAVGVTDSVSAVLSVVTARSPADPVGVTDARSVAVSSARSRPDPVGLTDAASRVLAGVRSRSDAVGVTDAVARAVSYVRTVADAVGVTDTGAPQSLAIGHVETDPVGVTDSAGRVVASGRSRADVVGVTDSVSVDLTGAIQRSPADPVGVSDAAARVVAGVRSRADAVGLSDAAARTLAAVRSRADAVGLADAAARVVAAVRSRADAVGLTDAVSAVLVSGIARTPSDPIGVTDSAARSVVGVRGPVDVVGLVDARLVVVGSTRPRADAVGLTDTVSVVIIPAVSGPRAPIPPQVGAFRLTSLGGGFSVRGHGPGVGFRTRSKGTGL